MAGALSNVCVDKPQEKTSIEMFILHIAMFFEGRSNNNGYLADAVARPACSFIELAT
jgi:hypothetical protein